jgi:hypothetical protein
MKRLIAMLVALALLWGGAGSAGAGAIQLTLPSQLNPGDTTFIYPQAEFDIVPSPYVASAGGNTLTYTNLGGGPFIRLDQGSGWGGRLRTRHQVALQPRLWPHRHQVPERG